MSTMNDHDIRTIMEILDRAGEDGYEISISRQVSGPNLAARIVDQRSNTVMLTGTGATPDEALQQLRVLAQEKWGAGWKRPPSPRERKVVILHVERDHGAGPNCDHIWGGVKAFLQRIAGVAGVELVQRRALVEAAVFEIAIDPEQYEQMRRELETNIQGASISDAVRRRA